ncbi:MAG TPA: selenocysteine lyase [Bacteroidetes bacterium]|nr:selenocysteine lyase [Bacteroidota bacterium]
MLGATTEAQTPLEKYFMRFRRNIIGIDQMFESPYGRKKIVYADWIASGRLYGPIERKMVEQFGPFVANTHTETSITGSLMTMAYHKAQHIIKKHVNAGPNDALILSGTGMTGVINKFQRILGLRVPDPLNQAVQIHPQDRPVVFITHMEHHSNQTSWLECLVDVVCLEPCERGLVNPDQLRYALTKFKERKLKIGAFSACSNVTGIETPYHELARIMHEHGGVCFVDFAMSAPYVDINMHPEDPMEALDAIMFSPHKFLGGPGTPGVLVFNGQLYRSHVPDQPGGGTVAWTNPWGEHRYFDDIEAREDGGTPGFLQAMRAALVVLLKEEMGTDNIRNREHELLGIAFERLRKIPGVYLLADAHTSRLGALSFLLPPIHYNLVVQLLNDRFGIQVRGGCSCAGTYGHYLLHVAPEVSHQMTSRIDQGDLSAKMGWIRLSLHPTMTNAEIHYVCDAIDAIARNHKDWEQDYFYKATTNEFVHKTQPDYRPMIERWFSPDPTGNIFQPNQQNGAAQLNLKTKSGGKPSSSPNSIQSPKIKDSTTITHTVPPDLETPVKKTTFKVGTLFE